MKYLSSIFAFAALLVAAVSCNNEIEEKEVEGNLVAATAILPEDGLTINLGLVSDPVDFQWSSASWDGIGYATYKVLFVRESGEFDKPDVTRYVSHIDSTALSVDKALLNEIFAKTAASAEATSATVKWTVVSMGGKKSGMSDPRTLTLTLPTLTAAVPTTPAEGATLDIDTMVAPAEFKWTASSWDGLGTPSYEVLFAAASAADFSKPVITKTTDATSVEFTVEEVTTLFEKTCAAFTDPTASAKWCVRTKVDDKTVVSEVRNVTIHKKPEKKFVAGMTLSVGGAAAIETAKDMVYIPNTTYSNNLEISAHYADNIKNNQLYDFDYEIWTKLEADQPVYIHCGEDWYLNLNNSSIHDVTAYELVESLDEITTVTVPVSTVYRIRLNTETKAMQIKQISKFEFRYWKGPVNISMTYDGNGRWHADASLAAAVFGYKAVVEFVKDGAKIDDQPYGAQFPAAATPTGELSSFDPVNDNYWHVVSVKGGGANATPKTAGTFMVPNAVKGVNVRYVFEFNTKNGTYTHCIENIE